MTVWLVIAGIAVLVALVLLTRNKGAQAAPFSPQPASTARPVHDERVKFPKEEAYGWMYCFAPGSLVFEVTNTDSMVPYLDGGEFVVLAKDYAGIQLGKVVAYKTTVATNLPVGHTLLHRIAGRTDQGWIAKGDAEQCQLETWQLITPENYLGTLVAVFRKA